MKDILLRDVLSSFGFTHLPTIMSSHSVALDRKVFHTSMVKMVLELLKMEVREDMRAAIITAIINPRSPGMEVVTGSDVCEMRKGVRTYSGWAPHLRAAAP